MLLPKRFTGIEMAEKNLYCIFAFAYKPGFHKTQTDA